MGAGAEPVGNVRDARVERSVISYSLTQRMQQTWSRAAGAGPLAQNQAPRYLEGTANLDQGCHGGRQGRTQVPWGGEINDIALRVTTQNVSIAAS